MSSLLAPACGVQVTEVAVAPDVKLIRPAGVVDLQRDQRERERERETSVVIATLGEDQIVS